MGYAHRMAELKLIVGPWRGEVGTEVTYWMPYVAKAAQFIPDFWSRAVVVSRGGMGRLYHPGVQTVDLYALRGVKEVASENYLAKEELGVNKPLRWTQWEKDVCEEIGPYQGYEVMHPSGMVAVLKPFWDGLAGWKTAAAHCDVSLIPKPPKPCWLPEKYTAVKWYHREGVKDEGVTQAWESIVSRVLYEDGHLVWVGDGGSGYDRHVDGSTWMIRAMPPGPPEDNLYRQAQVIAHAERFVGTYGGTAQLALRFGVPTVALYPGREPRHRAWNQWMADETGVSFVSGSLSDLPLMRSILA